MPEIINIIVDTTRFPAGTTSYTLYYFAGSGNSYNRVNSFAIPMRATLAQFQNAIRNMNQFTFYGPTYTLTLLDAANRTITNITAAVRLIYQISYAFIRPANLAKLPYTSISAVSAATVQEHSPGLSGTYMFRINGVPLNVYDNSIKRFSNTIQTSNSLSNLLAAIRLYYNAPEI